MGATLCLVSFVVAAAFSRKSLASALGFTLAVGCVYGWLRANFLDGLTHFCFDAALCGLYVGSLPRLRFVRRERAGRVTLWTGVLVGWPLMVVLLSPFLEAQHVFVQLAGLRNAVLFAPLLLLGGAIADEDLNRFASWAEWCVVGASCFAIAELILGVERFFPANEVTRVIYASNDIEGGFFRIPASFTSAHAYGGTMVALIPLLLGRLEVVRPRRWLTLAAIALASLGVFACGARLPVVLFGFVLVGSLIQLRRKPFALLMLTVSMAAVGYSVSQSSRLRRFETLGDPEMVSDRVSGSVNMSFWDILSDSPMGKGLGSAVGTSVPFFLADYARPPVGIESEFGRLLLEEGLPGLLLWLAFVSSTLWFSAWEVRRGGSRSAGMWIFCAGSWASGLVGTGLLASIPSTMILMVYLGRLSRAGGPILAEPFGHWLRVRRNSASSDERELPSAENGRSTLSEV